MIVDLDVQWTNHPDDQVDSFTSGWGRGILQVLGQPLWFHGSPEKPRPIEWDWITLLEFLGTNWIHLTTEQNYPGQLTPDSPLRLRRELRKRLHYLGEFDGDELEEDVLRFEHRHDLAKAMRGISLPSVFLVREGERVWVTADDRADSLAASDVFAALESLGDSIAEHVGKGTACDRREYLLGAWRNRRTGDSKKLILAATGLPRRVWLFSDEHISVRYRSLDSPQLASWGR